MALALTMMTLNLSRILRLPPVRRIHRSSFDPGHSNSISLAHPRDTGLRSPPSQSSESIANDRDNEPAASSSSSPRTESATPKSPSFDAEPPPPSPEQYAQLPPDVPASPPVPAPATYIPPVYSNPPFNTHAFVAALEKTFPTPTARSLMRATRALLVDRIGRVRREALTVKDMENVSDARLRFDGLTEWAVASVSVPGGDI